MVRKKCGQSNQCNKEQENGLEKATKMHTVPQSILNQR